MLQKFWFYPPLAIARLGPSDIPCENFHWGPNDLRPHGTGKTTIVPVETLHIAADGTITATRPNRVTFKDVTGMRPLCPFFELHGEWSDETGTDSGPITPQVLARFGLTGRDLVWTVEVANLKGYQITQQTGDIVAARVELQGDTTVRTPLHAGSPPAADQPLIPQDRHIPLGSVQLSRPSAEFPEFRLRFTPAKGAVYGPQKLQDLQAASDVQYDLPPERLILNPRATWCSFVLTDRDWRTAPLDLFTAVVRGGNRGHSMGLVDDTCDGLIRCAIPSLPELPAAVARVVVAPPKFAPDRRPFISLADGLADRVRREEVLDPAYVADMEQTSREVHDFFERILESVDLMNIDAGNEWAQGLNAAIATSLALPPSEVADRAFPAVPSTPDRPLPLTEIGRQQHRRLMTREVLENLLRATPELLESWIRRPMGTDLYFDRKMPALMIGSDGYGLHITRRQYDLLIAWARRLHATTEAGT